MIALRSEWKVLAILASLLLALLSPPLSAADPVPDQAARQVVKKYQQAMAFYNHLDAGANPGQLERWQHGTRTFQQFYRLHPTHELAPASLFMLGQLHHQLARRFNQPQDLKQALTHYQQLIDLFPQDQLAAEALFQTAAIYLQDQRFEEAALQFARIVADHPHSDLAAAASVELTKLPPPGGPEKLARLHLLPSTPKKSVLQLASPQIQPIRFWSTADYTRVVIETGTPVSYRHAILPEQGAHPRRLYIDLQESRLGPGMEVSVPVADGLLQRIRTAQHAPAVVRVVLDLQSVVDYKIFDLQEPFRIVIDARGKKPADSKLVSPTPAPGISPSLPQPFDLGIRRIVLDPGHGGKDTGAIGPSGIREKDIVLQVAKKLARHLERALGCEIIFTRDRDVFVPLEERTAIANASGADLLISIHANAAPSPRLRGVETYFLDFATSKEAMRVAARENASSSLQLNDLQAILLDLTQNTRIQESAKLAELVQASLVSGLSQQFPDIHDLGVKRAPFVVLIGAQMPAVLTEISFLSNPEEERRLADPLYQEHLATRIAAGISQYVTDLNLANMKLSTR